ncbi:hypothetical protein [Roseibium aestuarii]|uniref:hypothetical protein n=1 Tax=Roseibium aestuarii TaxID=2600299 RepID=UPI00122F8E39|nr:hypothetical protein [Roseibium aestuarii]
MREHPDGKDLLEQLDHVLYVAGHRNGDPYTFGPLLDESSNQLPVTLTLPTELPPEVGEFLSEEGRPLPPPDGALWLRREGRIPERLPLGNLS